MGNECLPSSVAHLSSLATRGVEAMNTAYILEVRVGAPVSTLSSKNCDLES